MTTSISQVTPVAISGAVGTTVSLYDVLVQTYGAAAVSQMTNVTINETDKSHITGPGFGFWDPNPANQVATHVLDSTGHDIGGNINADGSFHFVQISAADFKNTQIVIGNNIMPNITIGVPENSTWDTYINLSVSVLPPQLADTHPAGYVPTANDVVAAALNLANQFGGMTNQIDCHNIASAIAPTAGAPLDDGATANTGGPGAPGLVSANQAEGFWRIQESGGGPGWINQVKAGDIVRMELKDQFGNENPHTVTVVSGPDAAHPGQIQVVDNANGNHLIGAHWVTYDSPGVANNNSETTVAGSVTIYRLTTDGQYLIDQHAVTSNVTINGDAYNDLIKVGSGSDTVNGGDGNDTAALAGNKADYSIVHNADGSVTVTGHGATDKLVSIEHIQFNDQTVDLTANPTPPPPAGSVSINNVSITEGNNGSQVETFTVTRTGGTAAFDINYATADGTATTADGDYLAKSGTLHFADGVVSQTISVTVNGDTKVEPNETYNVNLSGATNGATISHAQGAGTIVNDDVAPVAGSVSINNVSITEGNNGSQVETFTVTRTGGTAAFDVNFATADGTATTANGDYMAKSGTLHFADGVLSQTISVTINGDTKVEPNETYNVNLSGATNGATISHAQGVGTIVNDDVAPVAGSVSINDVSITEGNNGSQVETFTVTRTGGSAAFDINYATADGTATTADNDYVAKSGTLHFADGVLSQTISVTINGDTKVEANEAFNVNLSGATNGATISHAQGVGTIVNDDTAPVTHHVANDFNGDGISDVLFGKNNGSLALWELNGNQIASNTTVGSVPAGWHIDGQADFNGDGMSDVLLHSDSGQVAMWQMNGNHIVSNTTVGSVGTDWHVAEIADFSGDGKADVLWENSKGQVAMWQMDGNHIVSNTTVASVGTDWHAIGAGDFNGDGKADVLWENSKGQVAMWEMNGNHIASNTMVGSVGSDWKIAGVGDFSGDGKADVLWENSKGQVAMWQMNGDHIASNTTVGSAPGWTVIGTGDYNHDGKADILLQNASGNVAEWQMNGDHIVHNASVGSHTTDWHMV
jgi:aspartate 1-decarboxylase